MAGGNEASISIVQFLKTDPKARYQGYTFYFREGFCWIDVNSTYLKSRLKGRGVFDVLSMSLYTMTQIPDWYFVCIINSELISLYVDNFINNTSHFQINDARQLPIIIPTDNELKAYKTLIDSAIKLKKDTCSSRELIESQLAVIQESIDESIERLFKI
jgi:hypothetical protein